MFSGSKFNGLKTRIEDVAERRRRGRVVLRKKKAEKDTIVCYSKGACILIIWRVLYKGKKM